MIGSIVFRVRCWLRASYYRRATREAKLHTPRYSGRMLENWCDYAPAHRPVEWYASVDGRPFGQSCFRHMGALMVDACKTGGEMALSRNREVTSSTSPRPSARSSP